MAVEIAFPDARECQVVMGGSVHAKSKERKLASWRHPACKDETQHRQFANWLRQRVEAII